MTFRPDAAITSLWELLNEASLPLFLMDEKGSIAKINLSAEKLLRKKDGNLPSEIGDILFDKFEADRFVERVFLQSNGSGAEYDLISASAISARLSPLYYKTTESGKYCFLFIQDTSELKQTRARLQISENRFRDLIQNSSLGLLEVDEREIIQYANSSFCALTGYASDELVGKNARSLLLPKKDSSSVSMDEVQERRKSGISDAYELLITGKNHKPIWVLISGAPIYDDNGKVTGSIGIHHDITFQKKEAEVRLKLMEELDQRNSILERQQQHLTTIYYFAAELLKETSTAQIYNLLYQTLPGKLGFTDCIVYHFNQEKKQLEWDLRFTSFPDPFPENLDSDVIVELGKGITGNAASTLSPLWIEDTLQDNRYIPDKQFSNGSEGVPVLQNNKVSVRRSEIAVPVVLDGQLMALIDAGNPEPRYFNQMHFETLITLANLTAIQLGAIRQRNALVENERRLRQVVDSSQDAIFMVNASFVISEINSRAIDLFGFDKNELIGKLFSQLFLPHNYEIIKSELKSILETEIKWKGETKCLKKDKSEFEAEIAVAENPIRGRKYLSFYIRDISLAKRSEAELRSALNKEAELNNLKTRFITLTSHEFRTPLTTIQSSAELLLMFLQAHNYPKPEKINKHVGRITAEVTRLTNLMNDILVIGRIDAGRISVKPESLNLVQFVTDILDTGQFIANDKRSVKLSVTGIPVPVEADPSLLNHVFQNLITNALKYPPGQPEPEILLGFSNDRCIVKVTDYGIGIPVSEQKDLFNTFFRASNVENIQGTGLGLTIIKQFIELHGTTISVHSTENKGSCFTFDLYLKFPTHLATYARNQDHTRN